MIHDYDGTRNLNHLQQVIECVVKKQDEHTELIAELQKGITSKTAVVTSSDAVSLYLSELITKEEARKLLGFTIDSDSTNANQ